MHDITQQWLENPIDSVGTNGNRHKEILHRGKIGGNLAEAARALIQRQAIGRLASDTGPPLEKAGLHTSSTWPKNETRHNLRGLTQTKEAARSPQSRKFPHRDTCRLALRPILTSTRRSD